MIRFSVVIPTYNRARLIGRAIDCVLRQTYPCQELIVVDDGSTDDTVNVVRAAGPQVRLIQADHGGPSKARNRGVREAVSEWIAFLDSDDLWHPEYLARMAHAIEVTQGAAAYYFSDVEYRNQSASWLHWTNCGFQVQEPVTLIPRATALVTGERHPMLLPFTVFRKEKYLADGGLMESLWSGEDTHLFIRIGLVEPLCAVGGAGGVVTTDETNPGNRLTIAFNTSTSRRWTGMVELYKDLLSRDEILTGETRALFRDRLAYSYWRVARLSLAEKRFGQVCGPLLRSLATDPTVVPRVIVDAFRRGSARSA